MTSLTEADRSQLQLLSILHYVFAGIICLGACGTIAWFIIGSAILGGSFDGGAGGPPRAAGGVMIALGAVVFLLVAGMALLVFFAGRNLARARNRTFCIVVAGLECLSFPFGTALGVFTLVVLMRDSVAAGFNGGHSMS